MWPVADFTLLLLRIFGLLLRGRLLLPHGVVSAFSCEKFGMRAPLTIFPWCRTMIWSELVTVERRWLEGELEHSYLGKGNKGFIWVFAAYAIVTVVLPAVTRWRASWISFSVWESSDAVASSSKRMRASFKIARAIAI